MGVAASIFEPPPPNVLETHIFFENVQMVVQSVLDISNGTKVSRKPKACGPILEQSLD